MSYASSKIIIDAPADAIWHVLSDFGAACRYLALIVNCTVEGQGIGAVRTLSYADGSVIVERWETLDEAAHRLSYALLSDTPFRDCLATLTVHALSLKQCEVEWSATFQSDGLPVHEAVDLLEGALTANCLALKEFVEPTLTILRPRYKLL